MGCHIYKVVDSIGALVIASPLPSVEFVAETTQARISLCQIFEWKWVLLDNTNRMAWVQVHGSLASEMRGFDALVKQWRAQPYSSRDAVIEELTDIADGWAKSADNNASQSDAATLMIAIEILASIPES